MTQHNNGERIQGCCRGTRLAGEKKIKARDAMHGRLHVNCIYTGVRRGGGGAAAAEVSELRADGGEEGGRLVQRPGQLLLVPRQQPAVRLHELVELGVEADLPGGGGAPAAPLRLADLLQERGHLRRRAHLAAFDVRGEEGGVAGVPGDLRLHQLRQIRRRRGRGRRAGPAGDPRRLAAGRAALAAARDPRVDAVQILHRSPSPPALAASCGSLLT